MIYVRNRSLDPCFNLAFEEYLFSLDTDEDIFCLWQNGPAVVSGRFQNIFAECDVPAAEDRGVAVLRRISGGGTVYHDGGNVNYTIIRNKGENGLDYDSFTRPVTDALRKLDVPAVAEGSCITVNGKKVSGSAETAAGNRVLHHGTLLYCADLDELRRHTAPPSRAFSSKAIASNPAQVGNIADTLGGAPDPERFADGLGLTVSGGASPVSEESFDKGAIDRLAEKYASWEWTFGSSPKFSFLGEKETEKGRVTLSYTSKNGVIGETEWNGPFENEMNGALSGVRLERAALRDATVRAGADREFAEAAARFVLSGK